MPPANISLEDWILKIQKLLKLEYEEEMEQERFGFFFFFNLLN